MQSSPGLHTGYEYSRTGNPTRQALEECVAALENGKYGLAFSSGSAACMTIMHLLKSGDHVICGDDVYGGTNRYFNKVAVPSNGFSFTFVDTTDVSNIKTAITKDTKLLWLETPTNPTLKITDIRKAAEIAHEHNLIVVVDNTFMSSYFQNPLDLGADIVMHSVTKFMNGHSDVVMGILATSDDSLYEKLKFLQNSIGAVPAPFDCYMVLRGLKTLHIRMDRHAENALKVATFLESHEKVDRVVYPGLPSHPQYALAKQQMKGFGGMITFYLKGGINESKTFLENLCLFALAESLGAVECLAEHPAIMTHAAVAKEHREKLGISDSLVRLSVGIEDISDILADLESALDAV